MKSGSKEWGHARNVWATGCQQLPLLPTEHLGSALHWNYPSRVFRELQETASPFLWNFFAKLHIFTGPHTGLVFICSDVCKIWFGTNCITGDLERRVTASLSVVFGKEHVGNSSFLPENFPSEEWQKGETEQLCHQTGILLLEAC